MKMRIFLSAVFFLGFVSTVAHATQPILSFEPDSMQRIVANQKGKPFVLVVWSLDCSYCLASLSNLAKEKRKRKNLSVVTLATDTVIDKKNVEMMKKKLLTAGISSEAWAFGSAPPEQLRFAIDQKWHGELPRSYWFNARGEKLAHSGVISPATIAKLMPD